MLESTAVKLTVGVILGFLSALGIGGGSLLVLWLTVLVGMEHQTAKIINLMFFLPTASISCLIRYRKGQLESKTAWPAIITGCIGAIAGVGLAKIIDIHILKKAFGTLLLVVGIREILYRPRNAR